MIFRNVTPLKNIQIAPLLLVVTLSIVAGTYIQLSSVQIFNITAEAINPSVEDDANFPWVVHIRSDPVECPGTLISKEWVLTSGSCWYVIVTRGILESAVYYNRTDVSTGISTSQSRGVDGGSTYPRNTIYPDIALFHLKTPFQPDPLLQPATLPPRSALVGDVGVLTSSSGHGSILPPGRLTVYRSPITRADITEFELESGLCSGIFGGDEASGVIMNGGRYHFVMGFVVAAI